MNEVVLDVLVILVSGTFLPTFALGSEIPHIALFLVARAPIYHLKA